MKIINSLNEDEWVSIKNIGTIFHLKKDQIIFRKGEHNDKEVFLVNGIVRGFIIDENGSEKSTSFFEEGEFMSTHSFRTQKSVSIYNYQALCRTKLLVFDSKELKDLLSGTKKLHEIGKAIKEREMTRLMNRDDCLMQVKALDKYQKFITFYPNLERQISQRYIASYLGITPVSLSRVKKSLLSQTDNN
ncbi:Crp/Fnr family transcriptional regulator [Flavobacterium limi]|uniref:cAMP-binding protein n=1 Tax=Flavobacterium limi TaxID=2045105 RepID=A0ABQ1TYI2_9FLAO|nr:Crp/Fnr family transcriptional regulator [Flavobacterium limi]GGF06369.1 cAMP-binding protein [Flavobacterium limi]